ncbi:MAG: tetratricopeptide repeat protein [Deltaproteobacteria bacterium]|nr:tetratricopeptide repeat protein [Deltaproteobacteria bacterium]MBW2445601.1 tetratricopeptide repeat protein [Deltaproteobacteria bacterium]
MHGSWLTLGLVLVLALGMAGCASDEEKVAAHITAAEEFEEAKDFRAALIELRSALSIQPKSADVNLRIADAYQAMGRPQAAFFYGEAYRLDKSMTRAALMQIPALYVTDVDAAEALVNEVLELEPTNVDAYTRRAEVLLVKNDTEGALSAALTGTELDPTHVNAHRMITSVYRARIRETRLTGRTPPDEVYDKAIAAADVAAAVSKDQEQLGEWYDRMEQALIYAEWEGHIDAAEQSIREAFRLAKEKEDPSGLRTTTREARRIATNHPDLEYRRWALERWVELEPGTAQGWRRLASLERRLGGSSDEVWARALEGRPDDVGLHAEYVRVLVATHREDEATEYLRSLEGEVGASADIGALEFELLMAEGDLENAKEALDRLKANHPEEPLTRLASATYDIQTGDHRGGLQSLRVLSANVERADVLRQLAAAESRAGNTDAALAAVNRAIELRPARSAQAHQLRIRLLAGKQDWLAVLRAVRDMQRLGLRPDSLMNTLRINSLYEIGRREAALPQLEAALAVDSPTVQNVLLFHRFESPHQPDRARRIVGRAWRADQGDPSLTYAWMNQLLLRNEREEAVRALEANAAITGRSAAPLMHARSLYVLGRKDEAEKLTIESYEMSLRPFGAPMLLTEILGAQGKVDVAIRMFEEAREAGTIQPAGLWQLGRIYYQLERYPEARAVLEESLAMKPEFSPALSDLALVLAELREDLDRAVTLARQVKSQNPENPGIADTLGYVYLQKGLAEPAAFEFRSAIELAKVRGQSVAEYHYHLGLALKAQGRDAEAGLAFDEALRIEPEHEAARAERAG